MFQDIANSDFDRLADHINKSIWSNKKILLTGGTGFFGAWILALFDWLNSKHSVDVTVYCVSRDPRIFLNKHPWARNVSWLKWLRGDIRNFEFPDKNIDFVLHAATDTTAAAADNPAELMSSVINGTQRILDFASQMRVQRILLVSSGAAYGAQPASLKNISETVLQAPGTMEPKNAYGEAKRVMEILGAIHAQQTNSNVVVARCFAFVGPGLPLDGHFAIGNFIRDAIEKEQLTIAGDGLAIRSYLYAADLAIWLLELMGRAEGTQIYNVGSDVENDMRQIAEIVSNTLSPSTPVVVKGRKGMSPVGNRYIPSIDKAREDLGLDVWTDLSLAIKQTAKWRLECVR